MTNESLKIYNIQLLIDVRDEAHDVALHLLKQSCQELIGAAALVSRGQVQCRLTFTDHLLEKHVVDIVAAD